MKNQTMYTQEGETFGDGRELLASVDPGIRIHEEEVMIPAKDGQADAALFFPEGQGPWPGVLIWPDIMGLRPVFRQMAERLARSGYVVLVVNPFYRIRPAPVVDADFSFADPKDREAIFALRAELTDEHVERDATDFVAYLKANHITGGGIAALGYCLGGGFAFRSAAAMPEDVAAVASFHASDLATASQTSPHHLVAKTKAAYLIQIAQNDDKAAPDAKEKLARAFGDVGISSRIDVCAANHGWCVAGSAAYDAAEADNAWARLLGMLQHVFG
jgi:carboxymethylenebutenolidase